MRPLVLLTDFGHADHYVGVLHAVVERVLPGATRIDLGHEVAPGDVWAACHLLRSAWDWLPAEAVVVVVVDPGVGSSRRPGAVAVGERQVIGPDTGVLRAVGFPERAVRLDPRKMGLGKLSHTFHGRDLFAPAAARLAGGTDLGSLGTEIPVDSLAPSPLPDPERHDWGWRGVVLHVDRFGNLVTNIPADRVEDVMVVSWASGRAARKVPTYADAAPAEVVWIHGSAGLVEISLNRESAAGATGLVRGDEVIVRSESMADGGEA